MRRLHSDIGMARLELGAILARLSETGAWREVSVNKTFRKFLEEEGIEPKAAQQYMRASTSLVLDLGVEGSDLRRISRASMRALVEASYVANSDNLHDVLAVLETLSKNDAVEAFKQMAELDPGQTWSPPLARTMAAETSKPVVRVLDKIGDLTEDQKIELIGILTGKQILNNERHSAHQ